MKVIIIGATGTIGSAVSRALAERHQVVGVSRHSRPAVDLQRPDSVAALFREVTDVDAVICTAGAGAWKPLPELTEEDFLRSCKDKLLGQVNVVRLALPLLKDGGCIILTTGILSHRPAPGGAAYSLVNAGLDGFTRAAALEAPRGIRVNAVSPPWVTETRKNMGLPPDPSSLPADAVARAYLTVLEGGQRGEIVAP